MAKKREGIQTIAGFVWKCVWLIFAAIMMFGGLYVFFQQKTFGFWLVGGFFCSIPVIGFHLKTMFNSMRDGARRGSKDYEVSVSSSAVTVQNHPFRTALVSLVITTIFCLLIGVFYLAFKMILAIIDIVVFIVKMVKEKKSKNVESEGKTVS